MFARISLRVDSWRLRQSVLPQFLVVPGRWLLALAKQLTRVRVEFVATWSLGCAGVRGWLRAAPHQDSHTRAKQATHLLNNSCGRRVPRVQNIKRSSLKGAGEAGASGCVECEVETGSGKRALTRNPTPHSFPSV